MRITRIPFVATNCTFDYFAVQYNLTMNITERPIGNGLPRYVAQFYDVEISDGFFLRGAYGEGNTEAEAISRYAQKLRGNRIVISAGSQDRREVQCPNEWLAGTDSNPSPDSEKEPKA